MPDEIPINNSYNKIFELLIKDPSSPKLEEMVSYYLYKKSKREWATEYFQRNHKKPDDATLKSYVETYTTSRLEGILKEGQGIVASYAESVIEDVTPQILRHALSERSFLRDAGVAFAGAFFYTIALIILGLVLKFTDVDVYGIFEKIFRPSEQHSSAVNPSVGPRQDALEPIPRQ